MTDEILKNQNKLASEEVNVQHLRQEVQRLREAEIRYTSERDMLNREKKNQTLLLQNLETIKSNMQKSETEGKLRLEMGLTEANRECAALRRRLQEEQDRFREAIANIEIERSKLSQSIIEKENALINMKNKVGILEDEIRKKNALVGTLNEVNKQSEGDNLTANSCDSKIIEINHLKKQIEAQNIEMESLKKELLMSREHSKQYCQMAEIMEKELKETTEKLLVTKVATEEQILSMKNKELKLQEKIEEMEREMVVKMSSSQYVRGKDSKEEHETLRRELKDAVEKLSEVKKDIYYLREQNSKISSDLQLAEQKYANEMILHSADIQSLTSLKEENQKLLEQYNVLKLTKDTTKDLLHKKQDEWSKVELQLKQENGEMESQLRDLQSHNSILHDQIENLNLKLRWVAETDSTTEEEANMQIGNNMAKSSDELQRIIKYLRKEKEIAVSKMEIMNNENIRIKAEMDIQRNKLEELKKTIKEKRAQTDTFINTTVKHEELLRKLETLNAMTDSNRVLREERDSLACREKNLSETINNIQAELLPLKEKNQELALKLESVTNENVSLRIEATRWRQRANLLVERSNKLSPEDMKRLQQDKENLCRVSKASYLYFFSILLIHHIFNYLFYLYDI